MKGGNHLPGNGRVIRKGLIEEGEGEGEGEEEEEEEGEGEVRSAGQ